MAEKETIEIEQKKELVPATRATKFVDSVMQNFAAEMGVTPSLNPYEKTLAQHLFLKADQALKEAEDKRIADRKDQPPFTWENVDARRLALDAVHRVNIGLDALIPNHLHIVPRLNGRTKKYTLTLQPGYEGMLYYKTEAAAVKPKRVICELVHKTDKFQAIKLDLDHEIETFVHEITEPFNRGDIVGGYGYIMYEDPKMNKLVLVDMQDFAVAEKMGNATFWKGNARRAMFLKTVVLRTMSHVKPDPRKINTSYAAADEAANEPVADDVIDITPTEPTRVTTRPTTRPAPPPPPPAWEDEIPPEAPMDLNPDDVPEFLKD